MLAVVCGLAPLLNPNGFGLASYVSDTVLFNGGGMSVGFSASSGARRPFGHRTAVLFYGSVVLAIVLLGAGRRRASARGCCVGWG